MEAKSWEDKIAHFRQSLPTLNLILNSKLEIIESRWKPFVTLMEEKESQLRAILDTNITSQKQIMDLNKTENVDQSVQM